GGGASVSGTLRLIKITNASNPANVKSWLGVEASDLSLVLEFAPLTLAVTDGNLKLNSVTGVGVAKLDWATLTVASNPSTDPADHNGLPFGLDIAQAVTFHLDGNVAFDLAGFVAVVAHFELSKYE